MELRCKNETTKLFRISTDLLDCRHTSSGAFSITYHKNMPGRPNDVVSVDLRSFIYACVIFYYNYVGHI